MDLENPCALSEERIASLRHAAIDVTTVAHLLDWGRREPALFASQGVLSDVVIQDEFTHDLVVSLTNTLVLVYAST
jgi:hypothetical protein